MTVIFDLFSGGRYDPATAPSSTENRAGIIGPVSGVTYNNRTKLTKRMTDGSNTTNPTQYQSDSGGPTSYAPVRHAYFADSTSPSGWALRIRSNVSNNESGNRYQFGLGLANLSVPSTGVIERWETQVVRWNNFKLTEIGPSNAGHFALFGTSHRFTNGLNGPYMNTDMGVPVGHHYININLTGAVISNQASATGYKDLGAVVLGKDRVIEWDIGYSRTSSGFLKVYMDGVLVHSYSGTTVYSGGADVEFRTGSYYGSAYTTSPDMEVRWLAVATTRAEAAPPTTGSGGGTATGPVAPVNVRASNVPNATGSVLVQMDPSPDPAFSYFAVRYSTDPNLAPASWTRWGTGVAGDGNITNNTAPSVTITGLTAGLTYYFYATEVNTSGAVSGQSNVASLLVQATTDTPPPPVSTTFPMRSISDQLDADTTSIFKSFTGSALFASGALQLNATQAAPIAQATSEPIYVANADALTFNALAWHDKSGGAVGTVEARVVVDFGTGDRFIFRRHKVWGTALTGVTGVTSTDIFTKTAHGLVAGDTVQFSGFTGGSGITPGQMYYVIAANLAANTFQVSATKTGAAIDLGTDVSAATVTKFQDFYSMYLREAEVIGGMTNFDAPTVIPGVNAIKLVFNADQKKINVHLSNDAGVTFTQDLGGISFAAITTNAPASIAAVAQIIDGDIVPSTFGIGSVVGTTATGIGGGTSAGVLSVNAMKFSRLERMQFPAARLTLPFYWLFLARRGSGTAPVTLGGLTKDGTTAGRWVTWYHPSDTASGFAGQIRLNDAVGGAVQSFGAAGPTVTGKWTLIMVGETTAKQVVIRWADVDPAPVDAANRFHHTENAGTMGTGGVVTSTAARFLIGDEDFTVSTNNFEGDVATAAVVADEPASASAFQALVTSNIVALRSLIAGIPNLAAFKELPPTNAGTSTVNSNCLKCEVGATDLAADRGMAKLYRIWNALSNNPDPNKVVPTNVSGTYSIWTYFPATTALPTATTTSTFTFQFKIDTPSSGSISDWWLTMRSRKYINDNGGAWVGAQPAADSDPAFFVEGGAGGTPFVAIAVPKGRWFEQRAEVYQNDRIDFFVDGIYLQSGLHSRFRVGPSGTDTGWLLGMGWYSDTTGKLYQDRASYVPHSGGQMPAWEGNFEGGTGSTTSLFTSAPDYWYYAGPGLENRPSTIPLTIVNTATETLPALATGSAVTDRVSSGLNEEVVSRTGTTRPYGTIVGVTGVASTDILTKTAHGLAAGVPVRVTAITGGSNLVSGNTYFVLAPTANTFQLALTAGGTVVDLGTDVAAATITRADVPYDTAGTGGSTPAPTPIAQVPTPTAAPTASAQAIASGVGSFTLTGTLPVTDASIGFTPNTTGIRFFYSDDGVTWTAIAAWQSAASVAVTGVPLDVQRLYAYRWRNNDATPKEGDLSPSLALEIDSPAALAPVAVPVLTRPPTRSVGGLAEFRVAVPPSNQSIDSYHVYMTPMNASRVATGAEFTAFDGAGVTIGGEVILSVTGLSDAVPFYHYRLAAWRTEA